jgi:hypothetical protein
VALPPVIVRILIPPATATSQSTAPARLYTPLHQPNMVIPGRQSELPHSLVSVPEVVYVIYIKVYQGMDPSGVFLGSRFAQDLSRPALAMSVRATIKVANSTIWSLIKILKGPYGWSLNKAELAASPFRR